MVHYVFLVLWHSTTNNGEMIVSRETSILIPLCLLLDKLLFRLWEILMEVGKEKKLTGHTIEHDYLGNDTLGLRN